MKGRRLNIAMIVFACIIGVSMMGLGIAAAAGVISNTWTSPPVTVTEKPLVPVPLVITSTLDGGGSLAKYIGDEISLTITIKNNGPVGYTFIKTHTSIYRTDGTIAVGDVELWHQTPDGVWQNLTSYLSLSGGSLVLVTDTADITANGGAHDTDITNLKVIFKTAGTYQAQSYSTN